jgi:hypothetical protein
MIKLEKVLPLSVVLLAFPQFLWGEYHWPLKPFHEVHGIHSGFCDWRRTHFHEGVDMRAIAGTEVYSVETAIIPDNEPLGKGETAGWEYLLIGLKRFIHIKYNRKKYLPGVEVQDTTQFAKVRKKRNKTEDYAPHLHFEEWEWDTTVSRLLTESDSITVPVNPLLEDHLEGIGDYDTLRSEIVGVWFLKSGSDRVLEERADGITIIRDSIQGIVNARDLFYRPKVKDIKYIAPLTLNAPVYYREDRRGHIELTLRFFSFYQAPPNAIKNYVYKPIVTFPDGSDSLSTMKRFYYSSNYYYTLPRWFYDFLRFPSNYTNLNEFGEWIRSRQPPQGSLIPMLASWWWTKDFTDGKYWIDFKLEDHHLVRDSLTKVVIVDNYDPTVLSVTPKDSSENIRRDSKIVVVISEVLDEASITQSMIQVTELVSAVSVPGTLHYVVRNLYHGVHGFRTFLTFEPDSTLKPFKTYKITVSDGLKDLAGNSLDGDGNGVAGGDFHSIFATKPPPVKMFHQDSWGVVGRSTFEGPGGGHDWCPSYAPEKWGGSAEWQVAPFGPGWWYTEGGYSNVFHALIAARGAVVLDEIDYLLDVREVTGFEINGNSGTTNLLQQTDHVLLPPPPSLGTLPDAISGLFYPSDPFDGYCVFTLNHNQSIQNLYNELPSDCIIDNYWSAGGGIQIKMHFDTSLTVLEDMFTPYDNACANQPLVKFDDIKIYYQKGVIKQAGEEVEIISTPFTIHYYYSDSLEGHVTEFIPEEGGGGGPQSGEIISHLPKVYNLNQNIPNPFTAGTAIRYQLPRPTRVVIKIYDLTGRLEKNS